MKNNNSNNISITDVIIYPAKKKNGNSVIKGFASVILNDVFRVNGLAVIQGKDGVKVCFNKKVSKKSGFWKLLQALNKETYYQITGRIINKYNLDMAKA
jgi:DNA-binding cell septation regulator SpoVG